MATTVKLAVMAIALACAGAAQAAQNPLETQALECSNCKAWNMPQKPFKVYGNTWYVGTRELSALLVTSPKGHVLLDGALPQSAKVIAANIKSLGFRLADVKLILNSHEHFDHAGGIAPLQRATGARVAASAIGARVLQAGKIGPEDPQFDPADKFGIEAIPAVAVVGDGEVLTVGELALQAHMTPGHAPGGTTWSWKSCEKGRCLDIVYADSLTMVSTDAYRFTDHPERITAFEDSVKKLAALKCDIVIAAHPGFTDTMEKAAAKTASSNPFIDPNGCRTYAAEGTARLVKRMKTEKAQPAAK